MYVRIRISYLRFFCTKKFWIIWDKSLGKPLPLIFEACEYCCGMWKRWALLDSFFCLFVCIFCVCLCDSFYVCVSCSICYFWYTNFNTELRRLDWHAFKSNHFIIELEFNQKIWSGGVVGIRIITTKSIKTIKNWFI